jgi:hypothetical protein
VTVDDDYGGTLGGNLAVAAVNGVATFSGISQSVAEDDVLDVTGNDLVSTSTDSFTVTAAPATALAIPSAPFGVLTNAPFSFEVDAVDPSGNIDPNFSGNVTIALAGNPGNTTLGGILTVAAVGGVATFDNLTIGNASSGYTLHATSTNLTAVISTPFDVDNQLVVTTQPPNTVTAGSSFGLVAKLEDGLGNVVSSFNGPITVTTESGDALGGTATVNAVSGVITFTGLTLTTADFETLDLTGGAATTSTNFFTVTPAAATQLSIDGPFGDVVPGTSFDVTVDAEDPFGNTDSNFQGAITVSLATNPTGANLGGTLTLTATNGSADFSLLTLDKLGTGYQIQATAAGLTAATSSPFNAVDQLVVTTAPPNTIGAGDTFSMTLKAENGAGVVDTSFNGSVTIALSNYLFGSVNPLQGTLTVNAVNGVAAYTRLSITQAGSQTIDVFGNGLSSVTTNPFTVTPGTATQIVVTQAPPSAVSANFPFGLTATVEDTYGNTVTSYNSSVTLTLTANPGSSTLAGTTQVTPIQGVATFSGLSLNHAGIGYTLQASTTGLPSVTTDTFEVRPAGVATHLVVTTQPSNSITAGTTFGAAITAEDDFGTVDASFNGNVSLTVNPSFGIPTTLYGTTNVPAVHGVATFAGLSIDQAGALTLSASSSGETSATTNSFSIAAASAAKLAMQGPNGAVSPGGTFTLQVLAEDPYGNVDPNFQGNMTIALDNNPTGATLGGDLTVAAVGGFATFSGLTLNKLGSGYTIQATAIGLSAGTSFSFSVVNQLVMTTPPPTSVNAGSPFTIVVKAEDGAGHVDTSFSGSVTMALIGNFGATSPLQGGLTVTAVDGVATFSGLSVTLAGSFSLFPSSTGLTSAASGQFTVTAAPATQLVLATQMANITVGANFGMAVEAEDPYGNVDTAFHGSVALALATNPSGGALNGTLTLKRHSRRGDLFRSEFQPGRQWLRAASNQHRRDRGVLGRHQRDAAGRGDAVGAVDAAPLYRRCGKQLSARGQGGGQFRHSRHFVPCQCHRLAQHRCPKARVWAGH